MQALCARVPDIATTRDDTAYENSCLGSHMKMISRVEGLSPGDGAVTFLLSDTTLPIIQGVPKKVWFVFEAHVKVQNDFK